MKGIIFLLNVLLVTTGPLLAQKAEVFSTSAGAIRGYDAVEYFKQNKAVKGSPQNVYSWKNAKWYFATKENLENFKATPEKYEPQYGGYCAYGLSEGHKAPTDPNAFTIVNGKLYLNYNLDVRSDWSKSKEERIVTADKNWPAVKNKE
ncbi:MAG: YHS domain-containing (seleno)protein [Ferruginibacter sp.]